MFFFLEKEAVFWSLGLIHLSHEMRTQPCHDWNEAQQQFYPWTFVGRDAHRLIIKDQDLIINDHFNNVSQLI